MGISVPLTVLTSLHIGRGARANDRELREQVARREGIDSEVLRNRNAQIDRLSQAVLLLRSERHDAASTLSVILIMVELLELDIKNGTARALNRAGFHLRIQAVLDHF